jgi:hypothetical protein
MVCKGVCGKYAVKRRYVYETDKRTGKSNGVTIDGKWCARCVSFMKWEGRCCPCCSTIFRTKPRTSKSRNKLEYVRY